MVWYPRIGIYLQSIGFTKSEEYSSLYFILARYEPLMLVIYVDEFTLTGVEKLNTGCKINLVTKFEMKDIGIMHYFMEIEAWQRS